MGLDDGGVDPFLTQQQRHGAANEERAPDDHRGPPRRCDVIVGEDAHDPCRRGRQWPGAAHDEQPEVERVQTVCVLRRLDGLDGSLCIEPIGQWELEDDPIHLVVGVELGDHALDICL